MHRREFSGALLGTSVRAGMGHGPPAKSHSCVLGSLALQAPAVLFPGNTTAQRPHLLLYVSRVLLHEFGEADVVGAEAAEPVQDAGLAGMQKRQVLRHLEGETVTDGRTDRPRRAGTRRGSGRGGFWPGPCHTWRPPRLLQVKTAPGYPLSASSSSWIILPRGAAPGGRDERAGRWEERAGRWEGRVRGRRGDGGTAGGGGGRATSSSGSGLAESGVRGAVAPAHVLTAPEALWPWLAAGGGRGSNVGFTFHLEEISV